MTAPRVVAVVLLLAVAGCTGAGSSPTPTTESTTAATATATPTESVTTGTTTTGTTDRWQTGVAPDERLTLVAAEDLTVTVTEYRDDAAQNQTGRVTYDLAASEQVTVTEFRVDGWVVVSVDDSPGWEGYVGSSNEVTLRVHADGNVTVTESSVK